MDSYTNFQAPPQAVYFLWSCDKVYHKQEAFFCVFYVRLSADNIILIYWIKIDHVPL